MAWAPIIGAGIQAGGALLGGILGGAGQSASNAQAFQQQEMLFGQTQVANQHFLDQQQGYNTLMSNTAYQRSMWDMAQAGLNPILAAGGNVTNIGSGGSGSISNPGTPQVGNPGSALQAGVSSAAQFAERAATIKAITAQADKDDSAQGLNKAQEGVAKETEKLTQKQQVRTDQETATSKSAEVLNTSTAVNKVAEGALMAANANSANAMARVNNRIAEDTERFGDSSISKAVGAIVRMLGTGSRVTGVTPNSAVDAAKTVTGPAPGAPKEYRRGPDGRPITDFWGNPK